MSSGWKAGYGWGSKHGDKAYSYSTPTSPTDTSFPGARTGSPIMQPFHVKIQPDNSRHLRIPREPPSDIFAPSRIRRPSNNTRHIDTLSESSARKGSVESHSSPTANQASASAYPDREFVSSRYSAAPSSSHQKPARATRPSTSDGTPFSGLKKSRGSLLLAASDVLTMKFRRKRAPSRQAPVPAPMPILLPDVIEICAPAPDKEAEEREQLKEMAAQSIGLGPALMQPNMLSRGSPVDEQEEEDAESNVEFISIPLEMNSGALDQHTMDSHPTNGSLARDSSLSVSPSTTNHSTGGRYRSGSMATHSRSNSTTTVPSYPSTPAALSQFQQHASTLPKYYQPSSLRIFALSKNWKTRHMILSSPTVFSSRTSGPPVSYLHLFKSSNPDEKELERFEINEESVVFVAEEEVGGRRHVVKVAGVDVGAMKKELNCEEAGRTMWFLQITESAEAQKWITAIKNAILGQRTIRAGLGLPSAYSNVVEPRGDMDVMLSMRAQGIISPTSATSNRSQPSQVDRAYASSSSSHSIGSQAATPRLPSTGPVSTLKGFFIGSGRPRAPSRAASDVDRHHVDRDPTDDSNGNSGSNSSFRPESGSSEFRAQHALTPIPSPSTPIDPDEHRDILERRIVIEQEETVNAWLPNNNSSSERLVTTGQEKANRTMSMGTFALQPPPRKRLTAGSVVPIVTIPPDDEKTPKMYSQMNGNASTAGIFGVVPSQDKPIQEQPPKQPVSPTLSGFSSVTPEQRSRTESVRSVSTTASVDNQANAERISPSTKKGSAARRWSRQGILPQRLTPPSGPPPPAPSQSAVGGRVKPHPYAANDHSPSRTSSHHSNQSQLSMVSNLPSFSKRASVSSATSSSTSQSQQMSSNHSAATRSPASNRSSMPPPSRPAPAFALPPAPSDQDHLSKADNAPFGGKLSREKPFRLSMASKPAPLNLLSRSDENRPVYRHSMDGHGHAPPRRLDLMQATSIPNSPTSSIPPFPPPVRPLPPPPIPPSAPTDGPPPSPPPPPPPSTSNRNSLKQRLRILSAPSSSSTEPPNSPSSSRLLPVSRARAATSASVVAASPVSSSTSTSTTSIPTSLPYHLPSPPITPIAEKITNYQDDPSFFEIRTPTIPASAPPSAVIHPAPPTSSPLRLLQHYPFRSPPHHVYDLNDDHRPPSPENSSHVELPTALSPPPRRGSRQITLHEIERLSVLPEEKEKKEERTPSPPAAVVAELAGGGQAIAFIDMASDTGDDDDDDEGEYQQDSFAHTLSSSPSSRMISLSSPASVNSLR